jgi:hypothetical protein
VRALKPKEKRRTVISMWAPFDSFRSKLCRMKECYYSKVFETELLKIARGGLTEPTDTRENCADLPLLISGLTKSEMNKSFVGCLYEQAHDGNVSVVIMVKDEIWADELIKLNGGVKILPVDQVIDNLASKKWTFRLQPSPNGKSSYGISRTSLLLPAWKVSPTSSWLKA